MTQNIINLKRFIPKKKKSNLKYIILLQIKF